MQRTLNVRKSACGAIAIYLIIGALLLINMPDSSYSGEEKKLFFFLFASYTIVCGLVVLAIARHRLYIFEPFSIIALLYISIFLLRPIQDLYNHQVVFAGVDLVNVGPKATSIFTMGFICFYLGYYAKKKRKTFKDETLLNDNPQSVGILVIMWFVFFAFCIISMLSQGISMSYIFSIGQQGDKISNENSTVLLFLSNFATSMLVVWMMIMVRSKSKVLKLSLSLLTLMYLVVRNARWLVLIMVLAPIVYYYTKRKKSPNALWTAILGVIALVVFAWMQMNRYNISVGREMKWFSGGLTLDVLVSPLDSDLTTYTTFYGMVKNYPSIYPYMLGQTFIYVFVLLIPRAVWPMKPDNPVREMVENSLGSVARTQGRAVPNIGEFYANFGLSGVSVLMFLFGYISSKLKNLYEMPSENRLIIYSVLYPLMFQWVARGNFSGNCYYTIFAFIPLLLQSVIKRVNRGTI